MSSPRILYVGSDLALLEHLQAQLGDYRIIRSPNASTARLLIEGINYSLLLFDEELTDGTGFELAGFVCSLMHRQRTPFIILKKLYDFELLLKDITNLLAG
jgi:DNA-binding response OmpR family regulator